MARKARWLAATAVGAVAAGASLWMLTPASATGAVNPVEGGLGFLVLVERDATLTGIESEGPVAIGGDLTFGSAYRIAAERSVRIGAGDSPLVIGGRALLGAPPVVDAKVLGTEDQAAKDDSKSVLLRATDPCDTGPGRPQGQPGRPGRARPRRGVRHLPRTVPAARLLRRDGEAAQLRRR